MRGYTLEGRSAIVTGANRGLGKAIALAYVGAGASVAICARDGQLLAEAERELRALAQGRCGVLALEADVSRDADVRDFVEAALREFGRVEILVNNAGLHGPIGTLDQVDWNDWMRVIGVNLLGSVRFARALIPHFKAQRYGKIVQLSGGGATRPLVGLGAYAASKAAVVRFAENLAVELRDFNVDANAIAPGALNTRLLDEVLAAGPEKVGPEYFARLQEQSQKGGTPLEIPARLAVFLGSAASDGITGKLISAPWDEWEKFPEHLEELRASDVYTLRRIVGKDRGMPWGDK